MWGSNCIFTQQDGAHICTSTHQALPSSRQPLRPCSCPGLCPCRCRILTQQAHLWVLPWLTLLSGTPTDISHLTSPLLTLSHLPLLKVRLTGYHVISSHLASTYFTPAPLPHHQRTQAAAVLEVVEDLERQLAESRAQHKEAARQLQAQQESTEELSQQAADRAARLAHMEGARQDVFGSAFARDVSAVCCAVLCCLWLVRRSV